MSELDTKAAPGPAGEEVPGVPAVETRIALDMIRRGAPVLPVLVLVAGAVWGLHGALSAAFAVTLSVLNFLGAAYLTSAAARKSLAVLGFAALGGYLARLAVIFGVVLAVRNQPWVELVALGVTLAVTHALLVVWEARHVSFALAFPGLKPRVARG